MNHDAIMQHINTQAASPHSHITVAQHRVKLSQWAFSPKTPCSWQCARKALAARAFARGIDEHEITFIQECWIPMGLIS